MAQKTRGRGIVLLLVIAFFAVLIALAMQVSATDIEKEAVHTVITQYQALNITNAQNFKASANGCKGPILRPLQSRDCTVLLSLTIPSNDPGQYLIRLDNTFTADEWQVRIHDLQASNILDRELVYYKKGSFPICSAVRIPDAQTVSVSMYSGPDICR